MSYVISKGGRSLDVPGVGRIRVDADKAANVPAFMERLATLPELERVAELATFIRDYEDDGNVPLDVLEDEMETALRALEAAQKS